MKHKIMMSAVVLGVAISACSNPSNETHATSPDMCISGGTIYSGVGDSHTNNAVLVKDGKIVEIAEPLACNNFSAETTKIVHLDGAFLYPGFVDGHGHFLGIGLRELTLNLEGTRSIKELQDKLAQEVAKTPEGTTIFGRGWIETHWPENRFPTKEDLDTVAPNHIVILERADGHAIVINSNALRAVNISKDTKPPFGGDILIGKDGNPSGMLIDLAASLVGDLMPVITDERKQAAFIKASEVYTAYGWTGLQSMSVDAGNVEMMEQLSGNGRIKLRVYNAVDIKGANTLLDKITAGGAQTSKDGHIITRGLKFYADGALGSRGAALLAPYSDDPKNSGLLLSTKETLMPIYERALRDGIQISTHAIGDRANRLVLDWYEEAFAKIPVGERKVAEPRWRIEHSQILDVRDIKRFSQLGVIASMQMSHAIGDLHFAPDRLGHDRLAGGYAWRSLIDSGALIIGGTDAPVERGDPRVEFYAAVARKDIKGFSNADWYPSEKLTRSEALALFTSAPAYGAFAEKQAGTIAVGKNADFTIFSKDIMTIPEAEILTVETVMTIVDGEIVYKK